MCRSCHGRGEGNSDRRDTRTDNRAALPRTIFRCVGSGDDGDDSKGKRKLHDAVLGANAMWKMCTTIDDRKGIADIGRVWYCVADARLHLWVDRRPREAESRFGVGLKCRRVVVDRRSFTQSAGLLCKGHGRPYAPVLWATFNSSLTCDDWPKPLQHLPHLTIVTDLALDYLHVSVVSLVM